MYKSASLSKACRFDIVYASAPEAAQNALMVGGAVTCAAAARPTGAAATGIATAGCAGCAAIPAVIAAGAAIITLDVASCYTTIRLEVTLHLDGHSHLDIGETVEATIEGGI